MNSINSNRTPFLYRSTYMRRRDQGSIRRFLLLAAIALVLLGMGAMAGWHGAGLLQKKEITSELELSTHRVLERLQEIVSEAGAVFARLSALDLPHCSDEMLLEMRTQLFEARFIKDIGGVDRYALRCSTALGRLETPLQSGPPDIQLASGLGLRTDRSVLASARFRTMILETNHFNALIDPRLVTDLTSSANGDEILLRSEDSNETAWHAFQVSGQDRIEILAAQRYQGLSASQCEPALGLCIMVHRQTNQFEPGTRETRVVISSLGGALGLALFFAGLAVVRQRETPEYALGQAIRHHRIHAVYQPILKLPGQELYAVEALARWVDDSGRAVPAEAFIDLAERTGQITQISQLMIRRVSEDIGAWLSESEQRRVALNIAPAELADATLVDQLEKELLSRGIKPEQILLEITERTMFESESASAQIEALTRRGFRVFADDFGVGYCGLGYLNELDMDGIKINQSFTAAVGTDSPKAALVPKIIEMANELGLEVIIEGVENERQHRALEALAPVMVQGWYFSRELRTEALLEQFSSG